MRTAASVLCRYTNEPTRVVFLVRDRTRRPSAHRRENRGTSAESRAIRGFPSNSEPIRRLSTVCADGPNAGARVTGRGQLFDPASREWGSGDSPAPVCRGPVMGPPRRCDCTTRTTRASGHGGRSFAGRCPMPARRGTARTVSIGPHRPPSGRPTLGGGGTPTDAPFTVWTGTGLSLIHI